MNDTLDAEEHSSDTALNYIDQRGWSMKRGHCKRLLKPKRGKAALRAEIQGQGKEVVRGRSSFSRTIGHRGKSRPDRWTWRSDYPARTTLRQLALAEALVDLHPYQGHSLEKMINDYFAVAEYPAVELDEIFIGNEQWNEELESDGYSSEVASLDQDSVNILSDAESLCEVLSSSPSTATSLPETRKSLTSTMLQECMNCSVSAPWEQAMARADSAALLYELFLKEERESMPQPLGNRQKEFSSRAKRVKKQKKKKTRQFSESHLWRFHKTLVSWPGEQRNNVNAAFQNFRKDFLCRHGMQVCAGLQSCFQCPIQLEPTPLDVAIQQRFIEGINGRLDGTWCPAFHGTANKNLRSIYNRGLLIPGVGNSLKVSHGSAHGLGIYAATASNAYLSWGFCDDKHTGNASMLVCAVLDDSSNTTESRFYGRFPVRAESANIKRVGGAFVVFEPSRIAPLFVASKCREPPSDVSLDVGKELRNKGGPCSSTCRHRTRHGTDVLRRRLIAICGHSVALRPRTKERKKGVELLRSKRLS